MQIINNKHELVERLDNDVKNCQQKNIIFLAGHFPIFYTKNNKTALEDFKYWGNFSTFTLELACIIAQRAKSYDKNIKFVFFVDDHAYEEIGGLLPRERSSRRNNLYKLRSGKNAQLPLEYKNIMKQYGFSENDVLRHDHNKDNRRDCLYFSEKILRASTKKIENACAREFVEFIENKKYFNKNKYYLVAFIPNRCKSHICDIALTNEIKNLNASHIFMETLLPMTSKEDLFKISAGVTYRKD